MDKRTVGGCRTFGTSLAVSFIHSIMRELRKREQRVYLERDGSNPGVVIQKLSTLRNGRSHLPTVLSLGDVGLSVVHPQVHSSVQCPHNIDLDLWKCGKHEDTTERVLKNCFCVEKCNTILKCSSISQDVPARLEISALSKHVSHHLILSWLVLAISALLSPLVWDEQMYCLLSFPIPT